MDHQLEEDEKEVILLQGNPLKKVILRWLPFGHADAWFTLLGSESGESLQWLVLDAVDMTSIAPGALHDMPALKKLTLVKTHESSLDYLNLSEPFHTWGLPANAAVCVLTLYVDIKPPFSSAAEDTLGKTYETCCPASCSNCCLSTDSMDRIRNMSYTQGRRIIDMPNSSLCFETACAVSEGCRTCIVQDAESHLNS